MATSAEGNLGQDVKARNEITEVPCMPHPSPRIGKGEKQVPRSNGLEGKSPDLIIHITALMIINIAGPSPLQKPSFQFSAILLKGTFLRGISWAQTALLFLRTRQEEK